VWEIVGLGFDDPAARGLLSAALAELVDRYGGGGDDTPLHAGEFDPPVGCFLVARVDGVPAGCGGWRTPADGTSEVAEIKRMYTLPEWRCRGVAAALLRALEDSARGAGRKRMALETGYKQPEAIALYQKLGYEQIPNFGHYADNPLTVSFGRRL